MNTTHPDCRADTPSEIQQIPVAFYWCSSLAAAFAVLFCWGVFERELLALGFNATLFCLLCAYALAQLTKARTPFSRENLMWSLPLLSCGFSYALYDNYFLKGSHFVVLPLMTGVLLMIARRARPGEPWQVGHLFRLAGRTLAALFMVPAGAIRYVEWLASIIPLRGSKAQRIVVGLLALTIIGGAVVVPLLSGAEPLFEKFVGEFYDWLWSALQLNTLLGKIFTFFFICSLAVGAAMICIAPSNHVASPPKERDQIIGGIIIGGILLLYLVFLAIQFERLFIGTLPIEFHDTERLVKTGFWQLLTLSGLNITLVMMYRFRSAEAVLQLLRGFSLASLLLLASAGYRMGLYVFYYGLSHQKFFASYAVLYCALVLIFLLITSVTKIKSDPIQTAALLFVAMYSMASLLPVERIIFQVNIALAQRPGARLALYDMKMLSPDIAGLVEDAYAAGELDKDPAALKHSASNCHNRTDWSNWISANRRRLVKRRWYEMNVSTVAYLLTRSKQQPHSRVNYHCGASSSCEEPSLSDTP